MNKLGLSSPVSHTKIKKLSQNEENTAFYKSLDMIDYYINNYNYKLTDKVGDIVSYLFNDKDNDFAEIGESTLIKSFFQHFEYVEDLDTQRLVDPRAYHILIYLANLIDSKCFYPYGKINLVLTKDILRSFLPNILLEEHKLINTYKDSNNIVFCYSNEKLMYSYNNCALGKKMDTLLKSGRLGFDLSINTLVYNSKFGSLDDAFNKKAKDVKGRLIECRHLAYEQLKLDKTYHTEFSSIEKIANNLSLKENFHDENKIDRRANEYYMFSLDKFGACLASFCEKTKLNDKQSMLLHTRSHTMAVTIKHKPSYFVIKFYDPNSTTAHKRALCKDTQAVKELQINNFLDDERDLKQYFADDLGVFAIYNNLKEPRPYSVSPIDINTVFTNPDACKLFFFIYYNDPINLISKIKLILRKNINSQEKVKLIADYHNGETPQLYMALRKDREEVVTAFVSTVLDSEELSEKEKIELLLAKDSEGIPGLYIALQDGYARVVTAFVSTVLESKLSEKEKVELLLAKDSEGNPGLYIALQEGHTEVVELFCKAILESKNLNENSKVKILTPKASIGYFGLSIAMVHNHVETVIAFANAVLVSSLTDEQKVEIMLSKDSRQNSALYLKFLAEDFRAETVTQLINLISNSRMGVGSRIELLQAKSYNGSPLLTLAMREKGRHKVVANYTKSIVSLPNLESEHKLSILNGAIGKNKDISTLFLGMSYGNTDAVIILLEQLLHLKIGMDTLNEWMIYNKLHGMLLAISKDNNFLRRINKIFLGLETQKKELFKLVIESQQEIEKEKLVIDPEIVERLGYKGIDGFWKEMAGALGELSLEFEGS
jgi:hypothetical protein